MCCVQGVELTRSLIKAQQGYSPDHFDALMLTFAARGKNRQHHGIGDICCCINLALWTICWI